MLILHLPFTFVVPDAVQSLNIKDATETEVDVFWNPPERHDNVGLYELMVSNSSGSCLKAYNLTCSDRVIRQALLLVDNAYVLRHLMHYS